jgi:hypothetical protein
MQQQGAYSDARIAWDNVYNLCDNQSTRGVALVEEIESQRVATTAGVQQREDCRDNVYNVCHNQRVNNLI